MVLRSASPSRLPPQQHSGDNDAMQAEVDKRTDGQVESIRSQFGTNKQAVVDKLLERVMEVRYSALPACSHASSPLTHT